MKLLPLLFLCSLSLFSLPAKAESFIENPVIEKIEDRIVEFKTPYCFNTQAEVNVRLLLLDTNYVTETVVKENVLFKSLIPATSYSYTFDNNASKYTIMVNGVCNNSSYFNNRLKTQF
jgi:hypothetical protein